MVPSMAARKGVLAVGSQVTLHNKSHSRETQEGGCPCSGEKQQVTEQETGFYRVSWANQFSRVELFREGIDGISS